MKAFLLLAEGLLCFSLPRFGIAFRVSKSQLAREGVMAQSRKRRCCGARPRSSAVPVLPHEADCTGIDSRATEWADRPLERNSQGKIMLKGLTFSELQYLMASIGEKPDRAEVLCGWLYHSRRLIRDVEEAAGVCSTHGDHLQRYRVGRQSRKNIRASATADGGLEVEGVHLTADGTRKMVSVLTCGEGAGMKVETVLIPMLRGPQRLARYTVCVSSQVGCAMNCQFCYTGRLGLMAHLQTSQIVEQVVSAKRYLESIGDHAPVTGVVFMGMGEPFDNYERVMRAVKILTDSRAGMRLKASKVTVSTVGLVPEIERFCSDPENGASMAISLHTVSDEVRDQVIPINRRYPLTQLRDTLRKHFPRYPSSSSTTTLTQGSEDLLADAVDAAGRSPSVKKRRRARRILAVEYTLMRGVNDSPADAERLATWLEGITCVVNLITLNPHDGTPFSQVSVAASKSFRQILLERGQLCTYRDSRGDDGMAACGQLGGESMSMRGTKPPVAVKYKPNIQL